MDHKRCEVFSIPKFPHKHSFSLVYYEGSFYAFGGVMLRGSKKTCLSNDLHRYHIQSKKWTKLTTSNTPCKRTGHSAVVFANGMFIFGGNTEEKKLNDIHRFDFQTKMWIELSTLGDTPPLERTQHSAVCLGCIFIIFGGLGPSNDIYSFDMNTFCWKFIENKGDIPNERYGHSACLVDFDMYIFGGVVNNKCVNDLYCWNIISQIWRRIKLTGEIPLQRCYLSAVLDKDEKKLIIFGGETTSGEVLNDLYDIKLPNGKCKKLALKSDFPKSRCLHKALLIGQNMYIFGGIGNGEFFNDTIIINYPKMVIDNLLQLLHKCKFADIIIESQTNTSEKRKMNEDLNKLLKKRKL